MKKQILITGGAGSFCSHLCERILEEGHEVLYLDNCYTVNKGNIYHLMENPLFEFIR